MKLSTSTEDKSESREAALVRGHDWWAFSPANGKQKKEISHEALLQDTQDFISSTTGKSCISHQHLEHFSSRRILNNTTMCIKPQHGVIKDRPGQTKREHLEMFARKQETQVPTADEQVCQKIRAAETYLSQIYMENN